MPVNDTWHLQPDLEFMKAAQWKALQGRKKRCLAKFSTVMFDKQAHWQTTVCLCICRFTQGWCAKLEWQRCEFDAIFLSFWAMLLSKLVFVAVKQASSQLSGVCPYRPCELYSLMRNRLSAMQYPFSENLVQMLLFFWPFKLVIFSAIQLTWSHKMV